MRNSVFTALLLVFTTFLSNNLAAQSEPSTLYMQVTYVSVNSENDAEVREQMLSEWVPNQIERVERGEILDWNFYEALITGPFDSYNYVYITNTTDYAQLFYEPEVSDKGFRVLQNEIWVLQGAALPTTDGDRGEQIERDDIIRISVPTKNGSFTSEVSGIGHNGNLSNGNYITKNYMDTRGSSGEHRVLELDFWRQIHHVRIDNGILDSWAMYTMSKPGGSSRLYNYSTIDYYDSLDDISGFDSRALAEIAHPLLSGEQIDDFFNRTGPSRTAYKTELWRRIATTHSD